MVDEAKTSSKKHLALALLPRLFYLFMPILIVEGVDFQSKSLLPLQEVKHPKIKGNNIKFLGSAGAKTNQLNMDRP